MVSKEHPIKTIIEKAKEGSLSMEQARILAYTYIDSALRDISIHIDSDELESSEEYQNLRIKLREIADSLIVSIYNHRRE